MIVRLMQAESNHHWYGWKSLEPDQHIIILLPMGKDMTHSLLPTFVILSKNGGILEGGS